jgi:hypothetical protein
MKRRQAIQALLATPMLATPALAQRPAEETPKLAVTAAEATAEPVRHFFTREQFAAMHRLGDLLVPAGPGRPGASEANAAEFLDFLLSRSGHERQVLYSNGLDALQLESGKRYNRRFEDLTVEQAAVFLEPLKTPSNLRGSPRFLRAALDDLLMATFNSREYAEAQVAAGRRAPGMGTYWFPVD